MICSTLFSNSISIRNLLIPIENNCRVIIPRDDTTRAEKCYILSGRLPLMVSRYHAIYHLQGTWTLRGPNTNVLSYIRDNKNKLIFNHCFTASINRTTMRQWTWFNPIFMGGSWVPDEGNDIRGFSTTNGFHVRTMPSPQMVAKRYNFHPRAMSRTPYKKYLLESTYTVPKVSWRPVVTISCIRSLYVLLSTLVILKTYLWALTWGRVTTRLFFLSLLHEAIVSVSRL